MEQIIAVNIKMAIHFSLVEIKVFLLIFGKIGAIPFMKRGAVF